MPSRGCRFERALLAVLARHPGGTTLTALPYWDAALDSDTGRYFGPDENPESVFSDEWFGGRATDPIAPPLAFPHPVPRSHPPHPVPLGTMFANVHMACGARPRTHVAHAPAHTRTSPALPLLLLVPGTPCAAHTARSRSYTGDATRGYSVRSGRTANWPVRRFDADAVALIPAAYRAGALAQYRGSPRGLLRGKGNLLQERSTVRFPKDDSFVSLDGRKALTCAHAHADTIASR